MYEQTLEFTKRSKPFMVPALIVAALPINQARHILRDYGWDENDFLLIASCCQEGSRMTGNVTNIINILSAISY